jgi:hypothetical protein
MTENGQAGNRVLGEGGLSIRPRSIRPRIHTVRTPQGQVVSTSPKPIALITGSLADLNTDISC